MKRRGAHVLCRAEGMYYLRVSLETFLRKVEKELFFFLNDSDIKNVSPHDPGQNLITIRNELLSSYHFLLRIEFAYELNSVFSNVIEYIIKVIEYVYFIRKLSYFGVLLAREKCHA